MNTILIYRTPDLQERMQGLHGPVQAVVRETLIVLNKCCYLGVILQRQTTQSYYALIIPKLIS